MNSLKYVFGPVPSRRLGQSLGIDPIPLKTCNWNCVYCQLGRTQPLTNERKVYSPPQAILEEVGLALESHSPGEIDWVTFVGSGEPTLHIEIGRLIQQVKSITTLPVAILTNGSLLYLSEVREALSIADAVLPTLDAGDPILYRKINRPWPRLTFESLVEGLLKFRSEYQGKLWIEVMLVRGLNDNETALHGIADILAEIRPDEVHINLPTRPPAESWVELPDEEGLLRAQAILGNIARVVQPTKGAFDLSGITDPRDAILAILTRHPIRQEDVEHILSSWTPAEIRAALNYLQASGHVQTVERYGTSYWCAAGGSYATDSKKR